MFRHVQTENSYRGTQAETGQANMFGTASDSLGVNKRHL